MKEVETIYPIEGFNQCATSGISADLSHLTNAG
jgi:hypothetical protein